MGTDEKKADETKAEALQAEIVSYPYPAQPPVDAGLEIISIIRSGSITANISRLAKAFHVLEGYAFLKLFGEPDTQALVAILPETETPSEALMAATPENSTPLVTIGDFLNAVQTFVDLCKPEINSASLTDNSEAAKLVAGRQEIKLSAVPWGTILTFLKQYGPVLVQIAKAAKGLGT